ncbi:MAG: EamA/RhaT family transporter, partial [Bacteroidales bacterium]|nr:EamA/RhaT family transporter [Bacteroidales bacterium]
MKKTKSWIGHVSCFTAYFIFGINIIVGKDLTKAGIFSPLTIFTLRAAGATLLFWILGAMLPAEKVDRRDLPKIF